MGNCSFAKAKFILANSHLLLIEKALEKEDFMTVAIETARLWIDYANYSAEDQAKLDALQTKVFMAKVDTKSTVVRQVMG